MACSGCPSSSPAVSSDCTPTGSYRNVADLRTYFTGSAESKKAILVFYDVFGIHNTTLHGADRLAEQTGALVIVPDFWKGKPLPLDALPPDTDEKMQLLEGFKASLEPDNHVANVRRVVDDLTTSEGIAVWGSFGLCFGGIITSLMSGEGSMFTASGTAHPGRPNPEVAKKIAIPYICLFSNDDGEPATVEEYGNVLKGKPGCVVDHYSNMHHGWMAARANLKDEANLKEFERGWNQAADFFNKNM